MPALRRAGRRAAPAGLAPLQSGARFRGRALLPRLAHRALAVVLGLRGWRQDRRTGEPLHPLLGMLGMICGVVAFAIGVLFFMAMFRNWETGRGGIRA